MCIRDSPSSAGGLVAVPLGDLIEVGAGSNRRRLRRGDRHAGGGMGHQNRLLPRLVLIPALLLFVGIRPLLQGFDRFLQVRLMPAALLAGLSRRFREGGVVLALSLIRI